MQPYYFLFGLALLWTVFATVQDLRKREVANWLTHSLVIFALAFRAFYSSINGDWRFFIYGLIGFGIFFVLAYMFYYGRVFAGGDAKLLMGLGAVIPGLDMTSLAINMLLFLFFLFFFGAVYSVLYSFGIVYSRYSLFKNKFSRRIARQKKILFGLLIVYAVIVAGLVLNSWLGAFGVQAEDAIRILFYAMSFAILFVLLYDYLKALEEGCLIVKLKPLALTEGDWLERDVKLGSKWIRKSVHGLSLAEINKLRKARKEVWIRQGIPFVPAFLIALLVMGYLFLVLGLDAKELFISFSKIFS